jgi:hypothetical protein
MNLTLYEIKNFKEFVVGEVIEYDDKICVVKWFDYRFPEIFNDIEILMEDLGAECYLVKSKVISIEE